MVGPYIRGEIFSGILILLPLEFVTASGKIVVKILLKSVHENILHISFEVSLWTLRSFGSHF